MCRSQVAMIVLKITRRFPNSSRLSNRLIIRLGLRNITRRIRMVRIRMNKVKELIKTKSVEKEGVNSAVGKEEEESSMIG